MYEYNEKINDTFVHNVHKVEKNSAFWQFWGKIWIYT